MDKMTVWESGVQARRNARKVLYPLSMVRNGKDMEIGTLVVMATLDEVYERFLNRVFLILVSNTFKMFFVAVFMLFIFYRLATRYLMTMACFLRSFDFKKSQKPMPLARQETGEPDEFDEVVEMINTMGRRGYQAYRDMKESEERLRLFFNPTEEGILTVDQDGVCDFMNGACRLLFGFLPEESILNRDIQSIGKDCFVRKPGALCLLDHIETVLHKGQPVIVKDQELCLPDGSCCNVFLRIYPLMEGAEKRNGAIVFLTDITREIHLQEQVQHMQKLDTIGKLSASIAHEFGNPLLGVRFAIRELKNKPFVGQDDLQMMTVAEDECDRMRRLVRDLRHLSRPTSGRAALCDLNKLLGNVLLLQTKFFHDHHVTLHRDFARDLPEIFAVSDQIRQVVINLIINAAEAMAEEGGSIVIRTSRDEDGVVLTITDTGSGIAEEGLPHIFEPFFTTKGEAKGVGLGLAVSSGIILRHGGTLKVHSTRGRGASFIITLPIESPAGIEER